MLPCMHCDDLVHVPHGLAQVEPGCTARRAGGKQFQQWSQQHQHQQEKRQQAGRIQRPQLLFTYCMWVSSFNCDGSFQCVCACPWLRHTKLFVGLLRCILHAILRHAMKNIQGQLLIDPHDHSCRHVHTWLAHLQARKGGISPASRPEVAVAAPALCHARLWATFLPPAARCMRSNRTQTSTSCWEAANMHHPAPVSALTMHPAPTSPQLSMAGVAAGIVPQKDLNVQARIQAVQAVQFLIWMYLCSCCCV